jgi:thioredoxin
MRLLPRLLLLPVLVVATTIAWGGTTDTTPEPPLAQITTAAGLKQALKAAKTPVIIDFHATWCGPCHMLNAELQRLVQDHPGAVTVVQIDVDQAPELAQAYRVELLPTLVLAQGGSVTKRQVGFTPANELASWAGLTR